MKACGISKMPLLVHYRLPEGGTIIKCGQLCHAKNSVTLKLLAFITHFMSLVHTVMHTMTLVPHMLHIYIYCLLYKCGLLSHLFKAVLFVQQLLSARKLRC